MGVNVGKGGVFRYYSPKVTLKKMIKMGRISRG